MTMHSVLNIFVLHPGGVAWNYINMNNVVPNLERSNTFTGYGTVHIFAFRPHNLSGGEPQYKLP